MTRRVVVTGGAGFLGSHLCDLLLARGDEVVCVDNLVTGGPENLARALDNARFTFIEADVSRGLDVVGRVDAIAHLASAASPPEYLALPLETLAVGSRGSEAVLELAQRWDARVVLASTSEVYGDPLVHPQPETYWGNVNPVGPRSVYDEAKRFAEALFFAYRRARRVNTGVVRIFNTFGPRLRPQDGRVVSNFIAQAITGRPLTVFGGGEQTRSLCYVDDLVRGLAAMLDSDFAGPVNIGNPYELSVLELAQLVIRLTASGSRIEFVGRPVDDPQCRRPDITVAARVLGWKPEVDVIRGLMATIAWQRSLLADAEPAA
jgi:dTDP-glucose 4,6-dehydratase